MKKSICRMLAAALVTGLMMVMNVLGAAAQGFDGFGIIEEEAADWDGNAVNPAEFYSEDDEDPEEENLDDTTEEALWEDEDELWDADPEGEEEEEDDAEDTDSVILRTELVPAGTQVWRIEDDMVFCEDIARPGDEPVSRSVEDIVGDNHIVIYAALTGDGEENVRLCAVMKGREGTVHIVLDRLAADPEGIRVIDTADRTGPLEMFFGERSSWHGVEMTGLSDAILICALDENGIFHVYRYDPNSQECTKLGYLPLAQCTAVIPCGENVLIVGPSPKEKNVLDLTLMYPAEGKMEYFGTVGLESDAAAAANIAFSETENMLYYTAGSIAFRVSAEPGSQPVSFASMEEAPGQSRNGIIIGEYYVIGGEDGTLLLNDIHAEQQIARIRVSDRTDSESVRETAAVCSAGKTQYYVTVSGTEDGNGAADDFDVCVSGMSETGYAVMKADGFIKELNIGESVRTAVADMPQSVREGITDGDRLLAIPVASACECFLWDVNAFQEVTGLSREALPTDWTGFLTLLKQIAEEGKLNGNNAAYVFCEPGITAGELRELIFSRILRDCLLWMNRDATGMNDLPEVMMPVLQAFEQVNWSGLGLPEEKMTEDPEEASEGRTVLLSVGNPDIAENSMMEGIEYWPLSVTSGGERLIPQTVSVMWIHSRSEYPEAAAAFLDDYWENMDILTKMTLCQSMNEPIAEEADEDSESEEDTEDQPGAERDSDRFPTGGEESVRWIASAQSIAEYRSLAKQIVPVTTEFGSTDEEYEVLCLYLEGKISAEQFIHTMISMLQR